MAFVKVSLLLSGLHFSFGGQIYFGEILLCVYGLHILIRTEDFYVSKSDKRIRLLFVAWFAANLVSSLLNHKSPKELSLAIFTVLVTFLLWVALVKIVREYPRSLITLLIYYSVGGIIGVVLQPTVYTQTYTWKFGLGPFVTIIGLCFAGAIRSRSIALATGLALSYISITHEARSLAALTLLSTFSLIIIKRGAASRPGLRTRKKSGHFLGVSIALSVIIYVLYAVAGSHGLLGQTEFQRLQLEQNSSLGPLAGRSEFVYSVPAFLEKPYFGYGYNPDVSANFLIDRSTALAAAGVRYSGSEYGTEKLPIHSYVMQNLIIGGFISGFFWLYVLWILVRLLKRIDRIYFPWIPVLTYLSFSLIWAIFFSPYGAGSRLSAMLTLVLAQSALGETEEKGPNPIG